jgi:hypothetical protein
LTFRGALSAVASNSQALARKSTGQQKAALKTWEANGCKNAHQAICRAESDQEVARTWSLADEKIIAVLEEIPADKHQAVIGRTEERNPGARLTPAMVRRAWRDVQQAEPDEDGGDLHIVGSDDEPPEVVSRKFTAYLHHAIHKWRHEHPAVSSNLLAIVLHTVATDLEKELETNTTEAGTNGQGGATNA